MPYPLQNLMRAIDLELVIQPPASTKNLLHGHQLRIPPPIDDDLIFASPTKVLPGAPANEDNKIIELPGAGEANMAELRNKDSNSTGSARSFAEEGEEGTPDTMESSSEDTATIGAALRGDSSPSPAVEAGSANKDNKIIEPSGALAVGLEPIVEETPAKAPMDKNSPQTPTDITRNYQFPSEERVLARARTARTVLLSRGNANFDDLKDSDEGANTVEPTKDSRFHRPSSPTPHGVKFLPCKLAPLTIPVPDTKPNSHSPKICRVKRTKKMKTEK